MPSIDIELNRFHDDNRVVNDNANRKHQPEQAGGIDGKAESRKKSKRTDNSDRNREQRNQRRAPVLKKDEYDQNHQ